MSGVPPRGPGKVTLVDAFSALLAAEQGDGSAEASLTAWEPANGRFRRGESGRRSDTLTATEPRAASGDAVEVANLTPTRASGRTPPTLTRRVDVTRSTWKWWRTRRQWPPLPPPRRCRHTCDIRGRAAAEPAAPAVSQEQLEAVVRKVLGEMTDSLVREIVTARVLDVAERLVREEIERLKAAAEADQA